MIPLWLAPLLKDKRTWIAVGVVIWIALMIGLVLWYGDAREKKGMAERDVYWNRQMLVAVERAREVEREVTSRRIRREMEAIQAAEVRQENLAETRERIANAETVEEQFVAYDTHYNRVRDEARNRHSRARESYLQSVGSDGDGSSTGTGSDVADDLRPPGG